MSRIGKQAIILNESINVNFKGDCLTVSGAKGELLMRVNDDIGLEIKPGSEIRVFEKNKGKNSRALWGLTRALISNMVTGVTKLYKKELSISGAGYKAILQGEYLFLRLGYSHDIVYLIPKDIEVPLKIKEYVEGNSLMYYFRFKDHKVLTMGSMNFIGEAIEGLEPNILLAGSANSRKEIYNYTERLLSLTNFPEIIIPTHWDDFRVTYEASQEKAIESKAAPFIEDVKRILPSAKVILPKHLAPMVFESK